MAYTTYTRRPHAATSGLTARAVAAAYNCPISTADGTGITVGVIELGGAWNPADFQALGLNAANVTVVPVDGAQPVSDGPNGADGEVALDLEIIAAVAPGAKQRLYQCPNTDQGFLDGINQAVADGCDFVSISWGGPESQWAPATMQAFDAAFAAARAKGVLVFVASGDSGPDDGTRGRTVDFPSSSPHVVGCGGTRLVLDSSGARASETVWDDNALDDASGGGVSTVFPGRKVPDVAANADPVTGYAVVVDGQTGVIGGTSAAAPLLAGMCAVVKQVLGKSFDLMATITANPGVCFQVAPARDGVTAGFGVVDFGKLLTVLNGGSVPVPPSPPTPTGDTNPADVAVAAAMHAWLSAKGL